MIRLLTATLLLSAALGGSALASDDDGIRLSDETRAQIRQTLTDQGYEVGKIKTEDGMYEAYARKDGQRVEVYLDRGLRIVRTKIDD